MFQGAIARRSNSYSALKDIVALQCLDLVSEPLNHMLERLFMIILNNQKIEINAVWPNKICI